MFKDQDASSNQALEKSFSRNNNHIFQQITLHEGFFDHRFTNRKYLNHEITRKIIPNNASRTNMGGGPHYWAMRNIVSFIFMKTLNETSKTFVCQSS